MYIKCTCTYEKPSEEKEFEEIELIFKKKYMDNVFNKLISMVFIRFPNLKC